MTPAYPTKAGALRPRWPRWLLLIIPVVAIAIFLALEFYPYPDYIPVPKTFDGDSDQLTRTVLLPTLDTPIPAGKSAIWCASFQFAWNELKDKLAKGPVELENVDKALLMRLNTAPQTTSDLSAAEYYAAAGFIRNGILDRIRQEMAAKFPSATLPQMGGPNAVAVAFAHLNADVKYEYPFFEENRALIFRDSNGGRTPVRSFGIRLEDRHEGMDTFREQVDVLFYRERNGRDGESTSFALDLSKRTRPNQVVLAVLQRRETLAQMMEDLQNQAAAHAPGAGARQIDDTETLRIPAMHWKINHRFRELEGTRKVFLNPPLRGLFLSDAVQMIQFKMDRYGTAVESHGYAVAAKAAERRPFDYLQPFLIVMKKRDAAHPFFLMWVDNAELLVKAVEERTSR